MTSALSGTSKPVDLGSTGIMPGSALSGTSKAINNQVVPDEFEMNADEKIVHFADQIDSQIRKLDEKLDTVLEKHEKDFLTSYRFHMLKVQSELTVLKQRTNEKEMKVKQEKKIRGLE